VQKTIIAVAVFLCLWSTPVFADGGFFLGSLGTIELSPTPGSQPFWGVFVNHGTPIGVELEFQHAPYRNQTGFGFKTLSLSLKGETPYIVTGLRLYVIGGGTMLWTQHGYFDNFGYGANIGGGLKYEINETFGLRVDGRLFSLQERISKPRIGRVYGGVVLLF
jgi:hypothetical protein